MIVEWKEPAESDNDEVDPIYGHAQLGEHEDDEDVDSIYREIALRQTEFIERVLAFLTESKSPGVAVWAVAYGVGSSSLNGKSMSDKATELDVSTQSLSKEVKRFQSLMMIGVKRSKPSAYMYKK
tara:strand:+ start:534 stop:908 length:375 start_codon:yes stop_codon:yes gene_type:complete